MMKKAHITMLFGIKGGAWVWCLHCERCYKVGEHRDGKAGIQLCHYQNCDGDAVMDAQRWEEIRERHPEYPEVPKKGKVYPLY